MNVIAIDKLSRPLYEAFGKVCADDDARVMLRYIYWDAEKGNLVATNGKSMLVCSYSNLKDKLGTETKVFTYQKGFLMEDDYLKKQGLEYVKYERVIPKWEHPERLGIYEFPKKKSLSKDFEPKYRHFMMMEWVSVNTQKIFTPSLFDMIKPIANDFTVCKWNKKADPIILSNDNETLQYVVMPFRISE